MTYSADANLAAHKRFKEKNPTYYREWHFKWAYGLSFDFIRGLYSKQRGYCAFCGERLPLLTDHKRNGLTMCLDHNHTTNDVRGLVHRNCNILIGYFERIPVAIEVATAYIRSSTGTKITGNKGKQNDL
jgi:Autographiviridae endonuclease VII